MARIVPRAKASSTALRSRLSEWAVRPNQEARRDLQRHPVRSGEDHARLIGMQPQDIFDYPELLRRPMDEGELPAVGAEDRAGLGVGPRQARQVGPLEVRLLAPAPDDVRAPGGRAGRTRPALRRRGRSAPGPGCNRRASGPWPPRCPRGRRGGRSAHPAAAPADQPGPGSPRPSRRGARAVEGARGGSGRAVMGLVEDHEAEAVADLLHVNVGAVVSRDRDRPHLAPPVSEHAGVEPQALPDPPLPLVHEIAERCDDEGRDAVAGDDEERDLRLFRCLSAS